MHSEEMKYKFINIVLSLVLLAGYCSIKNPPEQESQALQLNDGDKRMIKKFALNVLEKFEQTWASVHPVKVYLKRTEANPEFVHLVNLNELMLIVVFHLD